MVGASYWLYKRFTAEEMTEESTRLDDIYSAPGADDPAAAPSASAPLAGSAPHINPFSWTLSGNKSAKTTLLNDLVGSVMSETDPAAATNVVDQDRFHVIVQEDEDHD